MSLSAGTQRALATPSVPMEITSVTGTEFPDPDALASGDNHQVWCLGAWKPEKWALQEKP